MKIKKRTANAIKKRNMAWIGRHYGRSREAVRQWTRDQRIPDEIIKPSDPKVTPLGELLDMKIE